MTDAKAERRSSKRNMRMVSRVTRSLGNMRQARVFESKQEFRPRRPPARSLDGCADGNPWPWRTRHSGHQICAGYNGRRSEAEPLEFLVLSDRKFMYRPLSVGVRGGSVSVPTYAQAVECGHLGPAYYCRADIHQRLSSESGKKMAAPDDTSRLPRHQRQPVRKNLGSCRVRRRQAFRRKELPHHDFESWQLRYPAVADGFGLQPRVVTHPEYHSFDGSRLYPVQKDPSALRARRHAPLLSGLFSLHSRSGACSVLRSKERSASLSPLEALDFLLPFQRKSDEWHFEDPEQAAAFLFLFLHREGRHEIPVLIVRVFHDRHHL